MDVTTILGAVAIMGGLVALLGGFLWWDVVRQGNPPPEPTGSLDMRESELGPWWTPGSDNGGGLSGSWDAGGGGGGDGGGS